MADEEGKKEDRKEEKPSSGRWWEFYFVRYALGTVFGILIVHFLVNGGLAIPFPEGSIKDITKPEGLPLLIGYGLAYCYLASAPILVFHAARFSMQLSDFRKSSKYFLGTSIIAIILWAWWAWGNIDSNIYALALLAIWLITLLVLWQLRALYDGFTNSKGMWNFYLDLDKNRRVKENRELVDSYRHLREHANAFFVVCLELLLGLGIYVAGKVSIFPPDMLKACSANDNACNGSLSIGLFQTVLLIMLWIVPAAFVWTIACFFEREFADDKTIGKK